MSVNPISDKELAALLRCASAALECPDDHEADVPALIVNLETAALLLDQRRGL